MFELPPPPPRPPFFLLYSFFFSFYIEFHSGLLKVASYDFNLPILVNGSRPPSPPPSPWPPSQISKLTITSQQGKHRVWSGAEAKLSATPPALPPPAPPQYDVTPTRRVLATALRPPLTVSNTLVNFTFSPREFEAGTTTDTQVRTADGREGLMPWLVKSEEVEKRERRGGG